MSEMTPKEMSKQFKEYFDEISSYLADHYQGAKVIKLKKIEDYIGSLVDNAVMTEERAIYFLHQTGWMQKHDRAMSFDSLTALVNNLMRDGNKRISVNVYPWKEDD